jgi:hypothetical protein
MHYSKLSLLVAAVLASVGLPRLAAQATPANFEALLTESSVTLSYSLTGTRFTTTAAPAGGTRITAKSDVFSVTAQQVLRSLQFMGQIPEAPEITATSPAGWTIVAIRPLVTDLTHAEARYDFYAKNEAAGLRILINDALQITPVYHTQAYTEEHIGGYPIKGSGITTNYVELDHKLQFVRSGTVPVTYVLDKLLSWGNASLSFRSSDLPVFHYPINPARLSGLGEFAGSTVDPETEVKGTAKVTLTIGTPKLVYASFYPDTPVENVMIPNPFTFFFETP